MRELSRTWSMSGATAALMALLAGCAGGILRPKASYEADPRPLPLGTEPLGMGEIYRDTTGPVSYQSPTLKDVGGVPPARRVQGKACQRGLSLPLPLQAPVRVAVGWGRGAYQDALRQASHGLPAGAVLYDVRADLKIFMILTVYREMCLLVDAAVVVPSAQPTPPPQLPATPTVPPAAPPATESPTATPKAPAPEAPPPVLEPAPALEPEAKPSSSP